MKIYDTLIIGCSYSAVGYAVSRGDTVICEEHQICDTSFYLPLRSFKYMPYEPKTEEGAGLLEIFASLGLFGEKEQNTNGFEFAFCKYIAEKDVNVLLKCRVIRARLNGDGVYDVTVQTNEGLSHLYAGKIIDTTKELKKNRYTVLFVCDDIDSVRERLLSAFKSAEIEGAFYKNRYALHFSREGQDENRIKVDVYETWRSLNIDAKILYMAPVFYGEGSSVALCDEVHSNPIAAFESGYFYAEEVGE